MRHFSVILMHNVLRFLSKLSQNCFLKKTPPCKIYQISWLFNTFLRSIKIVIIELEPRHVSSNFRLSHFLSQLWLWTAWSLLFFPLSKAVGAAPLHHLFFCSKTATYGWESANGSLVAWIQSIFWVFKAALAFLWCLINGDTKTFDSKANKNQASVLRGKTLTRRDSTILFLIL